MKIVVLLAALLGPFVQPGGLKIVVIEGEGAVNIIQQKTAVAPLVEVRDRNNQPVSGAVVTFTIQGGNNAAIAGSAQTVSVTTNAAGRAAMTAINPVNAGTFQIEVQAAFQGQTAVAAITQTNVMTAAQAAAAIAAGGAGAIAASGAGAAAAGGGLSGIAIGGIVGGVAVAGAALAVGAAGGDAEGGAGGTAPIGTAPGGTAPSGTPAVDPAVTAASGTYTLQQINGAGLPALTVLSPPNPCPGFTDSGTMTLTARPQVFEMTERSHLQCSMGGGNTFVSSNGGDWTLQGTTLTLTTRGSFNIGPGTLNGSTLSFAFDAPHANTGNPPFRVTSTWQK